jgi:hypothetical protein
MPIVFFTMSSELMDGFQCPSISGWALEVISKLGFSFEIKAKLRLKP